MRTRSLGGTGVRVTEFGFGGAALGNLYRAVADDTAAQTVAAAFDAGARYYDTAPHYGLGLSERRLGQALAGRPRADFVVSTKVGRMLEPNPAPTGSDLAGNGFDVPDRLRRRFDFSADGVRRSLESSLDRLRLDRVDIVFVHDPDDYLDQAVREAIPALVSWRDEGVVRAVGVGMNDPNAPLRIVRETAVDVVMLAGRWSLLDRSGRHLLDECAERGVPVVAAAPYNSGLLARPRPGPDVTFERSEKRSRGCTLAFPSAYGRISMPEPTRTIRLAYGRAGLAVTLPSARTTVVAPSAAQPAADPAAVLRDALCRPVTGPRLRELVRPGQRVAVSVCDVTRPQPREAMLRALLDELDGVLDPRDLTVLVATGTHRANTDAELRGMFGDELVDGLRIVNHDARDPDSLTWCGVHGNGVPVWLNREWMAAEVRITTGFVEPHFFAGFSGGPKLVAPGLAGLETVLTLHDATRIGSPRATWGICDGNPVHDDVRAIAAGTGVTFAFDVVLNGDQQIVEAFGGPVAQMHAVARERVRAMAMCPVDGRFDVVVTSNAGYPLDQNLYQAVKGMSAAATIVKPGGLIVCAARCEDGFPDHGSFREVLASAGSPAELLATIAARPRTVPDQWQVQVLARLLMSARIGVYSDHLDAAALRGAHLFKVDDIAAGVAAETRRVGPQATICVLPEGPQTIPYLREVAAAEAVTAIE